jgi:hypothetical protein
VASRISEFRAYKYCAANLKDLPTLSSLKRVLLTPAMQPVMAFPIKYGLPPMCVEGQTPDSPAHVQAVYAHMKKVQSERKM